MYHKLIISTLYNTQNLEDFLKTLITEMSISGCKMKSVINQNLAKASRETSFKDQLKANI